MPARTIIVVKKVGEPPCIAQVCSLEDMQSIVEGHLDQITVAADGAFQVTIIRNEDGALAYSTHAKFKRDKPMPVNFVFPNCGPTIYGPFFVTKNDGRGGSVSLSDKEANAWIEFLSEKTSSDQHPPAKPESYFTFTESHQIMLLPHGTTDDETGDVLSPEDLIARMSKQVGIQYNLIPVNNSQVYGVAIACLDAQGVAFSIEDEETMLLDCAGTNENGDPVRYKKFLRVIEILDLDSDRPI